VKTYLRRGLLTVSLLASLLFVAACGGSSGENQVKSSGVPRVGTEGVYAPFSYHEAATDELVGYDVDVAKAVADKHGVRVEFVETPWDSIFAALEANRFDVVDSIAVYAYLAETTNSAPTAPSRRSPRST
jgi:cystine transport system permease protein